MRDSAGILLFRRVRERLEVLLVHPGGPFWAGKDGGSWSVPKGEFDAGEDPEAAARREFAEEIGPVPGGRLLPLGSLDQSKAKRVTVFALEGDYDVDTLRSNTIDIEWPPRSGVMISIPEVDRAEWFDIDIARTKMLRGQTSFIDRLERLVGAGPDT